MQKEQWAQKNEKGGVILIKAKYHIPLKILDNAIAG